MSHEILYLGDDDLTRAAMYLSGILEHFHLPCERVDGDRSPGPEFLSRTYASYVLSDYPRKNFSAEQLAHLRDAVENRGSGLLMIGGWESFHGRLGEYHDTVLKDMLPVEMESCDDRRNFFQPLVLRKRRSHAILDELPWETPPTVGGLNLVKPKPGAEVLLDAVRLDLRLYGDDRNATENHTWKAVRSRDDLVMRERAATDRTKLPLRDGGELGISERESFPMLILGRFGRGRTAAFAADVAPHWVGGLVDWGEDGKRLTQNIGDGFIEVGNHYARFFRNLVFWTAGDAW